MYHLNCLFGNIAFKCAIKLQLPQTSKVHCSKIDIENVHRAFYILYVDTFTFMFYVYESK